MEKPPCIIVDVDGTIVDVSGVRHYVLDDPRRKDFEHFHLGAMFCPPIEKTIALMSLLRSSGYAVVIVTARKERWRRYTRWYMEKHGIEYDALFMRADDDQRRDVDVKRDILATIRERWNPRHAIDDNPSVIAMWREEGLAVTVVPGWQR